MYFILLFLIYRLEDHREGDQIFLDLLPDMGKISILQERLVLKIRYYPTTRKSLKSGVAGISSIRINILIIKISFSLGHLRQFWETVLVLLFCEFILS